MWPFTKNEDGLLDRVKALEKKARILEAEKSPNAVVISGRIIHIDSCWFTEGYKRIYIDDVDIFCDDDDINRLIEFLKKHVNEKA